MPMLLKVPLHDRVMHTLLGTKLIPLDRVIHGLIITESLVARVSLRLLGPLNKAVEVFALPDLLVADLIVRQDRHRRVVSLARHVLPH